MNKMPLSLCRQSQSCRWNYAAAGEYDYATAFRAWIFNRWEGSHFVLERRKETLSALFGTDTSAALKLAFSTNIRTLALQIKRMSV